MRSIMRALAMTIATMATALRAPRRLATLPKRLARPSLTMRAPWEKFAASADALAPRALQGGADPTTLGEAWRWAKSYRFPEDVCEYAGGDAAAAVGAALDPSAAAVLVYTVAQLVFVLRAVSRVRAHANGAAAARAAGAGAPRREAALARGFGCLLAWHASHFLAHEFKTPFAWFGSHYFYVLGMWQLAAALNSRRAGASRFGAYVVGDGVLTAWGGDYIGLVSGVAYGAHAIRGCDTGDARTDRRVRRLITFLSVASASLFGLVEILFCHRLQRVRGGFGSAHLFIEAFVIFASISFSRAAETVVRRIPAAKASAAA